MPQITLLMSLLQMLSTGAERSFRVVTTLDDVKGHVTAKKAHLRASKLSSAESFWLAHIIQ
ncbi:MAG: hypothetical protein LBJ67_03605 [Planctomycetaceae bacterium]|jgi:hypothetical protein|nr:hypothetical protein [Planctomycetaceae bacterium]